MRTTNTQQTSSQARLLATDVPTGSNSWAENNTQVCKQNLEPDGTTSKTWSTEQRADQMLLLLLALLGNGLQSQPVQLGSCSCCWWSLFRPALVQQGINRPLVYHWPEQHINLFTLGSWFLHEVWTPNYSFTSSTVSSLDRAVVEAATSDASKPLNVIYTANTRRWASENFIRVCFVSPATKKGSDSTVVSFLSWAAPRLSSRASTFWKLPNL